MTVRKPLLKRTKPKPVDSVDRERAPSRAEPISPAPLKFRDTIEGLLRVNPLSKPERK